MLSATSTFGLNHFIMMGTSFLTIILSLIFIKIKHLSFKQITNIMLIIWILSELTKIFTNMQYLILLEDNTTIVVDAFLFKLEDGMQILRAFLPRGMLPFHLCSIQPLFILYTKFSKNETIKKYLFEFMFPTCTIGAILSIFLVTVPCSFTSPEMYQFFFFHAFIVVYGISIVTTKQVEINFLSMLHTIVMLLCLGIIIMWINTILSDTGVATTPSNASKIYVNFFYLYAPPLKNLPILNLNDGWYAYFFRLLLIASFLLLLLEAPLAYQTYKKKKSIL